MARTIPLQDIRQQVTDIKALEHTPVHPTLIHHPTITELHQIHTLPIRLREQYRVRVLLLPRPVNVPQATIGCRTQAAGAWLTAERTRVVVDTAAGLIRPKVVQQGHTGQVIPTLACHLIFIKGVVLPAHTSTVVLQVITGMAVNV